jgi:hypothetical protein
MRRRTRWAKAGFSGERQNDMMLGNLRAVRRVV